MTMPPEPPAGGNFLTRRSAGIPNWGWIAGGAVAGWLIVRWMRGRSSTDTTAADTSSPGPDASDVQSQYEQITSQLTGLEGTDRAILEAIQDLQGEDSKGDHDRDDRSFRKRGGGGTGPPPRHKRRGRRVAA